MSHDLELSVLKPIDAPTVLQVDRNVYCCVRSSLVTVNKLERMGTIVETHTSIIHTCIHVFMHTCTRVQACVRVHLRVRL